jgi:hypothetical protein
MDTAAIIEELEAERDCLSLKPAYAQKCHSSEGSPIEWE